MDRYLAGEHIDHDTLIADLEMAVARGSFYPVIATAVELGGLGTTEVLDLVRRGFPSPLEHPAAAGHHPDGQPVARLPAIPPGPLCAEVVKTTTDPYVGRLSLVRVFSGRLTPDSVVHVSGHFGAERGHEDHDVDERIGALSSPAGQGAADDRCRRSPATSSPSPSSPGPRPATRSRTRTPRCSWSRG